MAWESKVILLRVLDLETLVSIAPQSYIGKNPARPKTSHKDLPHPGHETYYRIRYPTKHLTTKPLFYKEPSSSWHPGIWGGQIQTHGVFSTPLRLRAIHGQKSQTSEFFQHHDVGKFSPAVASARHQSRSFAVRRSRFYSCCFVWFVFVFEDAEQSFIWLKMI